MNYEIEIKSIAPIRVAYLKYKGPITKANKRFPDIYKSIKGKANGAPFINYLSMNPQTKIGELELCVPTEQTPIGNGVQTKEMPHIKQALCVPHRGPYQTLFKAYEAIDQYALANKHEQVFPFREIFIKGPGLIFKGNPNKYITEIQFPIKTEAADECN